MFMVLARLEMFAIYYNTSLILVIRQYKDAKIYITVYICIVNNTV